MYLVWLTVGWLVFWTALHAACYWALGPLLLAQHRHLRLRHSLRLVSIVHAVIVRRGSWDQGVCSQLPLPPPLQALAELYETLSLGVLQWPPVLYDTRDVGAWRVWYTMAGSYYLWDLFVSLYVQYGRDFVLHALISFPVFFFGLSDTGYARGFYGRFYHGVFSLSTPWLHLRELAQACGFGGKFAFEALFALSFISIRLVMGTVVSVYFVADNAWRIWTNSAHSMAAVVISSVSCAIICALQLYWGREVVAAVGAALRGKRSENKK